MDFEFVDEYEQAEPKKIRTGLLAMEGDLSRGVRQLEETCTAFKEARRADEEEEGADVERKQLFIALRDVRRAAQAYVGVLEKYGDTLFLQHLNHQLDDPPAATSDDGEHEGRFKMLREMPPRPGDPDTVVAFWSPKNGNTFHLHLTWDDQLKVGKVYEGCATPPSAETMVQEILSDAVRPSVILLMQQIRRKQHTLKFEGNKVLRGLKFSWITKAEAEKEKEASENPPDEKSAGHTGKLLLR